MWDGTIAPTDGAVEIPKKAVAGNATDDSPLGFVGRIDADPEERSALVIKQIRMRERDVEGRFALGVGRPEETQDDIAPANAVEGKRITRVRPRFKPRRGFADP
jgi:hypothetical protein